MALRECRITQTAKFRQQSAVARPVREAANGVHARVCYPFGALVLVFDQGHRLASYPTRRRVKTHPPKVRSGDRDPCVFSCSLSTVGRGRLRNQSGFRTWPKCSAPAPNRVDGFEASRTRNPPIVSVRGRGETRGGPVYVSTPVFSRPNRRTLTNLPCRRRPARRPGRPWVRRGLGLCPMPSRPRPSRAARCPPLPPPRCRPASRRAPTTASP